MSNNKFSLPSKGLDAEEIKQLLEAVKLDPIRGHWSYTFRGPEDVQEIGRLAYNMFLSDNGILALRVPYFADIEAELIQMCSSLFNPGSDTTANLTSGGSESIYSALHAAREWAKKEHPHIKEPEVVAPFSAHPSFSKGCHYFGLKLVRTPLAPSLRANVQAMKEALTENTICLVGSAPCWPYGLYDPIEDIAALAQKNNLWMHSDACVGGYLAPFAEKLGHAIPAWDFRVPGVMSISADLHKYGYCHKSVSTVLWRSAELQQYHYVHPSDWPGGEYATTGFAGSRSGGPVFSAWAIMKYLGQEGYLELAKQVMAMRQTLIAGINAIEGLQAWDTDLAPLPFGAPDLDLSSIVGEMKKKGWFLLGCKEPPLVNLPVDAALTDEIIEIFLRELQQSVATVSGGQEAAKGELSY